MNLHKIFSCIVGNQKLKQFGAVFLDIDLTQSVIPFRVEEALGLVGISHVHHHAPWVGCLHTRALRRVDETAAKIGS